MTEYQFHKICAKLDKIIELLERLQPETLSNRSSRIVTVLEPIPDPNYPNPTWAPDAESTAAESHQ